VGEDAKEHNAFSAREALELATIGGAKVLGRDDIGALAPGKCADFAVFPTDTIAMSGSQWDPVAGLIFCGPANAAQVYVNGRAVVRDGRLATIDASDAVERHAMATRDLINRAPL
jgi:cytosine/adenosine deaminase-related metal-dependent hydrolase